jgi:hypothetical protein
MLAEFSVIQIGRGATSAIEGKARPVEAMLSVELKR